MTALDTTAATAASATDARDGGARADIEAVAEAVAAIVSAQHGVARLTGGRFGEIATYLPGRRIAGVRVSDADIEVHIVAGNVPLPDLGRDVATAVATVAGARLVTVVIDDIELGDGEPGGSEPAGSGAADTAPLRTGPDRQTTNFEI